MVSENVRNITRYRNARLSSGTLELKANNVLKFVPKNNIEITANHIYEFKQVTKNSNLNKYGLLVCLSSPFSYTENAVNILSKDQQLQALAIILKNQEKNLKNALFMEMASILPNPFQIPVKIFKDENCGHEYISRILDKKN